MTVKKIGHILNGVSVYFRHLQMKPQSDAYKNEIPVSLIGSPESHFLFMRMTGLEPARTRHQILNLACLPFHHIRINTGTYIPCLFILS